MEENKNKIDPEMRVEPKPWRGYTLEQLEHRRAINAVKSELLKEQIMLSYSMTSLASPVSGANNGAISNGMSRLMTVLSYGTQVFRYARTVYSLISRFRK